MRLSLHSRRKLKPADAARFVGLEPDLFVELATVVCSTGALPQKELHECWQMASCVHREFPDCLRVADIAAGHGLLTWILVLLARTSAVPVLRTAVALDVERPRSAPILAAAITARWPELAGSVHYVESSVDAVISGEGPRPLLVAAHACGSLSDRVLLAAVANRCPVAIMPCCHSLRKQGKSLASLALVSGVPSEGLQGVAGIDSFRIAALAALGYDIREASIQAEITPFNRIIMARPHMALEASTLASARPNAMPEVSVERLGERRAYQSIRSLDIGNACDAETLARRPSRTWRRSFDLSFWVADDATGRRLRSTLESLTGRFLPSDGAVASSVAIRDRYVDPLSQRLAFTYRIDIESTEIAITKADAGALRRKLCRGSQCLAHLRQDWIVLRFDASVACLSETLAGGPPPNCATQNPKLRISRFESIDAAKAVPFSSWGHNNFTFLDKLGMMISVN